MKQVGNILAVLILGLFLETGNSTKISVAGPVPFRIEIEGWSPYFIPRAADVHEGTPIVWQNPTPTHHTITHDGCVGNGPCAFDSGSIAPNEKFEFLLPPGDYAYHCTLHPIMKGLVRVQPHQDCTDI